MYSDREKIGTKGFICKSILNAINLSPPKSTKMEPVQNQPLFQLNLDAQNSYTLRSAASWAKVLGVCSIILGILFVIAGIIGQTKSRGLEGNYRFRNEEMLANIGLITAIIGGGIYLISGLFALNFGNKIGAALRANDQNALNSGFAGARNFFAFWTILLIITLLLVLIGVVGSIGS